MNKEKISWLTLETQCQMLANKIIEKEIQYSCIVGISRGGLIPATILSHLLGIKKLYTIAYKSYSNQERQDVEQVYPNHQDLKSKTILLVDDIADSGNTIIQAKKDLEAKGCKVTVVTLHYKKDSKIIPDIYLIEANNWLVYPWEND